MRIIPVLALLSTLLSAPAWGQEQNCAPFDRVSAFHAEKLNETRIAQGISGDGTQMLMIFASPNGETWSIVVVGSDGIACLKARGNDWQVRSDPAPVMEEGS